MTKYRVEPGFYSASLHTMANLKSWKKLSDAQRDIITKTTLAFEANSEPTDAKFQAALKKQKEWMAKEGMKTITFTGADGEKWSKAAHEEGWKEVIERSPEHGPKLRAAFSK